MNRKTFIILAAIISAFPPTSSAWFSRYERNRGPKGYSYVRVEADCFGTKIRCENHGYEKCEYAARRDCLVGSKRSQADQKAVDYARSQMEKGVRSGNSTIMGKRVTWSIREDESQITVDD